MMLRALAENATLEEMRVAMEAAPNLRSYIRLAVMRSLLMGLKRSFVSEQFCLSDRVVQLCIAMFNLGGIYALTTKRPAGRGRRVKLERLRDLLVPVLENPRQACELHCTGVKLHRYLKEQLSLEVCYSTTVRYLHELSYNLRMPLPWPERQNEEQLNAFLEQLRTLQAYSKLELWFADECGVESDPNAAHQLTSSCHKAQDWQALVHTSRSIHKMVAASKSLVHFSATPQEDYPERALKARITGHCSIPYVTFVKLDARVCARTRGILPQRYDCDGVLPGTRCIREDG